MEPLSLVKELIEERGYLPPNTPLLKCVAAQAGDEICRKNEQVFVNKNLIADALLSDSNGRDMPRWFGCFVLGEGRTSF